MMNNKISRFTVFALFICLCTAVNVWAKPKISPPQIVKAVVIGDRVIDIAFKLGVMPEAMSIRGGLWPESKKFMSISQILGCPKCITAKRKQAVPDVLKKKNIKKVIIEKNDNYCLYMPKIKPELVVPLLKDLDVEISYVDFNKGLESAIYQTAAVFGVDSAKANQVIAAYKANMKKTKAMLPKEAVNKKVVIINGIYQKDTGKSMLQVEAPGGYADQYFLKQLGCVNSGEVFNPKGKKPYKGHYMVKKNRGKIDLSALIEADPDIIIATGDALAVQKALRDFALTHPELNNVKAIKKLQIYALPGYIDSGVLEYPAKLRKWATALK